MPSTSWVILVKNDIMKYALDKEIIEGIRYILNTPIENDHDLDNSCICPVISSKEAFHVSYN